jgi:hypothetical protein
VSAGLEADAFAMEINISQDVRPFCRLGRRFGVFELKFHRHLLGLTEKIPRFIAKICRVREDSRLAATPGESDIVLIQVSLGLLTARARLQCRSIGGQRVLQPSPCLFLL